MVKVSLEKCIRPCIHGQREYMILVNAHHLVVHWLVSIFVLSSASTLCCAATVQYSRVVVSRIKKEVVLTVGKVK